MTTFTTGLLLRITQMSKITSTKAKETLQFQFTYIVPAPTDLASPTDPFRLRVTTDPRLQYITASVQSEVPIEINITYHPDTKLRQVTTTAGRKDKS